MESRLATLAVVVIVLASVVGGLMIGARKDQQPDTADLIIYNGAVFTGIGQPRAEAVAVRGGMILSVGTNRVIKEHRGPSTRMVDAHGATVLPGFNDAHMHVVSGGLGLERINLLEAQTLEDIGKTITTFAEAHPDQPWVLGRGWYYSPFPGGLPTRAQLDALVPDRPAYMTCYDGHTAWANSKALALAGITKATQNPEAGVIVRDARTGEPTGVLKEAAMQLMADVLPPVTDQDRLRALGAALKEARALGITSITEAGTSPERLALFEQLRQSGDLTVRVYAAMEANGSTTEAEADALDVLRAKYSADPQIRVGAIKFLIDGVIEAHTALMLAPYANKDTVGHTMFPREDFARVVSMFDRRGWQILTHAIGDGAVRLTLDTYDAAAHRHPAPPQGRRHRIEHAETIDPADIPRFAATGTIVSYMPYHANPTSAQLDVWTGNIGPERASRGWIVRTLLDHGARMTFGSDWPVVSADPRLEVNMAVTRRTPQGTPAEGWLPSEAISLETALAAVTEWPAYASFEDHRKGRLAAGQVADIVILSGDVFSWPPDRFLDATVAVTIFDGRTVYER